MAVTMGNPADSISSKKLARKLSKKLGRDASPEEIEAYVAKKEKKATKRKSIADAQPQVASSDAVSAESAKYTGKARKKTRGLKSTAAAAPAAEETADLSDFEYDDRSVPRDENARTLPKAADEGVSKKGDGARKKRADGLYPCKEFESKEACKFGDKCKFSHLAAGEALSEEAQLEMQQRQRKRNAICLTFQDTGECAYGDRCRYKHLTLTQEQKRMILSDGARMDSDRLIAECLQGKDSQEDKLKRIMDLPEQLRQKARAIFFAKQRGAGFGQGGNKNKNKSKNKTIEGQDNKSAEN